MEFVKGNLKEDTIVFVKIPNPLLNVRYLGRILKCFYGDDGLARSVQVKVDNREKAISFSSTDFTLWPHYLEQETTYPYQIVSGEVVDKDGKGKIIRHFPDVPSVFEKLKNDGIKIAIVSNIYLGEHDSMYTQLIHLFNWDKYISFKEIYPGDITEHFRNIQNKSQIPFDKMMFFDLDYPTITAAKELGILSFDTKFEGVTMKILQSAIQEYQNISSIK